MGVTEGSVAAQQKAEHAAKANVMENRFIFSVIVYICGQRYE
jgi:hypothetical protein